MRLSRLLTAVVAATIVGVGMLTPASSHAAAHATAVPGAPVAQGTGLVTTYQQNSRHDGVARGPALPATPHLAWSVPLGGTVSYPVIARGRVFVTVAGLNGGYGSRLYALDEQTGAILWGPIAITGGYVFSGVTYAAGRLFVINWDGVLRSFDAATGKRGWSRQLPGQSQFDAAPVAANGQVYVVGAGSGGTLYSVKQTSGELTWSQPVVSGDSAAPVVNATSVFTSFACEYTQAFTVAGAPEWTRNFGCYGGGGYTPVLRGTHLWVRDNFGMPGRVLSATDGHELFQFDEGYAPAVTDTMALVVSSEGIKGIRSSSGRQVWVQVGDGGLDTPPVVLGSTAYVGSSTGTVFAYDIATGKTTWTAPAGSPVTVDDNNATVRTGQAIADGTLFVPASERLVAYR